MKSIRKEAERAQSAKLHRLGAQGSLKMAKKGEHAKRKYASGGSVSDPMPGVEGSMPKPRLDRPSRSGAGAKGKKGTNVNVVIMQHPPMAGGAPAGAGPMPGPMPMPAHPPMPPMGAGGPPMPPPGMPMHKNGGRVGKYAKGGAVKRKHRAEGGDVNETQNSEVSEAAQKKYLKREAGKERSDRNFDALMSGTNAVFAPAAAAVGALPATAVHTGLAGVYGMAAKRAHDRMNTLNDEAGQFDENRRRGGKVEKMRAKGGRVEMTAGACTGEGRLEKMELQKKVKKA